MYNNEISNFGAQCIANGLEKNKTLTILYIGGNPISNQGVQSIANTLIMNKVNRKFFSHSSNVDIYMYDIQTLTTLSIECIQIDSQRIQCIADALTKNQTLTLLYMGRNQIGNQGAQYLANALKNNTVENKFLFTDL